MPHFGLMDEESMTPEEAAFLRARYHVRGGRRRLRQNKIAAGIAALYDALSSAFQWYVASPERQKALEIGESDDLQDDGTVFRILVRSGVLDDSCDFDELDRVTTDALAGRVEGIDHAKFRESVESILTQLGVLPFDESELPPEDPGTF